MRNCRVSELLLALLIPGLCHCGPASEQVQVTVVETKPDEGALAQARAALAKGEASGALALAQQWRQKEPRSIAWLVVLGEALALSERYEEAMEVAEQACSLAPSQEGPRSLKGKLFWIDGRFEEAAVEYRAALEAEPGSASSMKGLGLVLIQAGRYSEAAEVLQEALPLLPGDIQILNNLGVALASTGRLGEARDVYQKAVGLAPSDALVRNNYADVLLRLGQVDEASVQVDALVAMSPDRSNAVRLQKDLLTVSVVVEAACQKEKGVITKVEQAFEGRGWSREEADASLRRVTGDPFFDAMVRKAAANCPAP